MQTEIFRIDNCVDDYVIWTPETEMVNEIKGEIQGKGYYELNLDLQRSENRDSNFVSVFLREKGETYVLRGGILKIENNGIHTRITAADKIHLAKYYCLYFRKNRQYSDKSKQIFERFRYPMFTEKPDMMDYANYLAGMIIEKRESGLRHIVPSAKFVLYYHLHRNIPEEIRKALDHRNLYLFPHVLQTFERWTGSEILDSAMIILYCAGKNYLITTESSDGELQNFVSDIGQISVKDGWQRKYTLKMSAYDDEYGQFELYKRKGIRFS